MLAVEQKPGFEDIDGIGPPVPFPNQTGSGGGHFDPTAPGT